MSLITFLNTLRANRAAHEGDLTIPSQPVPRTYAQGAEVRLALGGDDSPILLLPVSNEELRQRPPDADGLEIEFAQYQGRHSLSRYFLQVTCATPQLESVFLDLVENVCSRIQDGGTGIVSLQDAIEEFRNLLRQSRGPVERSKIIGLFGELLFFKYAIDSGIDALEFWTGPNKGRRDFLFPTAAVEIKTSEHSSGRNVVIHSLGQLENDDADRLFLIYFRIEEDPGKGLSISELINQIESKLSDIELYHEKLKSIGYQKTLSDSWDSVRWAVLESQPFDVIEGFPRIVSTSFADGLPNGVSHVTYQVELMHAGLFEVSMQSVMERLLG